MANTKISGLTELAETPASNDMYQIIDVSDTTMSLSGTNKFIQASRLVHQDGSGNISTNGTAIITGSLGLGTATPTAKLHLVSNGNAVRISTTTATQSNYISFAQLNTMRSQVGYEDTNDVAFVSSMYGDLSLRASATAGENSATEYFVIKAGGNIGIGTATPTAKVDVAGTVQMDALRLDQTPTAGAVTLTHYINVSLNGTNYRIPCGTA